MDCRKIFVCAFIVIPLGAASLPAHAQSSETLLVPDPYARDAESQRERADLYANSYDSYVAPSEHQTKREREANPKGAADAQSNAVAAEARAEAKADAAAAARGN